MAEEDVELLREGALGEPPTVMHPVAAFGRAMTALESLLRSQTRASRGSATETSRWSGTGTPGADSWRDSRPAGAGEIDLRIRIQPYGKTGPR